MEITEARLPRALLDTYAGALNNLTDDCKVRLYEDIKRIDLSDVARARDEIITVMQGYLGTYTDMSSELSAAFYDGVRAEQVAGGKSFSAVAESGYSPLQVDEAVRGTMQIIVDNPAATEELYYKLLETATHVIKQSAANTTYRNVKADPARPRFARVPSASKSYSRGCPFCNMLASRGFVYYSKKAAGQGAHWHSGCRCVVVQSYNDKGAQGYDPDKCLGDWLNSMGEEAARRSEETGNSYEQEFEAVRKQYESAGSAAKYKNTERREQTQDYARRRYFANRVGL